MFFVCFYGYWDIMLIFNVVYFPDAIWDHLRVFIYALQSSSDSS
jgi:hypothetical protein